MDHSKFPKLEKIIIGYTHEGWKTIAKSSQFDEKAEEYLKSNLQLPITFDEFFLQKDQIIWRYLPYKYRQNNSFFIIEYTPGNRDSSRRPTYNIVSLLAPSHLHQNKTKDFADYIQLLSKNIDQYLIKFENKPILIKNDSFEFIADHSPKELNNNEKFLFIIDNNFDSTKNREIFFELVFDSDLYSTLDFSLTFK